MKKKLHYVLYVGLLLTGSLILTGCSDELTPDTSQAITKKNLKGVDLSNDITGGYNVVIWNGVDTAQNRLTITTTERVVPTCSVPGVSFRMDTASDKKTIVLVPVLSSLYKKQLITGTLTLTVPANSSLSKVISFVFQDTQSKEDVEPTLARVSEIMCYGGLFHETVGAHGVTPWLEKTLIQRNLVEATSVDDQKALNFTISGTNLRETSETFSMNVGVSAKGLPIGKKGGKNNTLFSGSISASGSESTSKKAYMEYYLSFYGENKVSGGLDVNRFGKDHWAYLTSIVNDVLNNPGSAAYQKYDDDPTNMAAAFALLDYYGTHLISRGMFGGYMLGFYVRAENAYSHSIEYDVDMSCSKTKQENAATNDVDKILQYLRAKNGMSQGTSQSLGFSGQESEYLEATKALEGGYTSGGTTTGGDISTWQAGNDPNQWVIISYNQKNANEECKFIPITDFIADKTSRRYKQLSAALYNDETDTSPYFESKSMPDQEDSPLILADFMMVLGDNNHVKGDPTPIVTKGPDNVMRVYYPMMANQYAPSDKGYAIETSSSKFVAASDYKDQYWYYALDHTDRCQGLKDIIFSDDSSIPGYNRRGNHANEHISGELRNTYVYVQSADANTPKNELITGVGLFYNGGDSKKRETFASSGGTEMASTWTESDLAYFDAYWKRTYEVPNSDVVYKMGDKQTAPGGKEHTPEKHFFMGLATPNDFGICYTRKKIEKRMIGNDRSKMICHPKKWKE